MTKIDIDDIDMAELYDRTDSGVYRAREDVPTHGNLRADKIYTVRSNAHVLRSKYGNGHK